MALIALPAAQAHHSPAMFDMQKQTTVSGTVRAFQWTNPHAYIQLLVKDAKGHDQEWSFELGAPMYLYAHGWRPSSVKAGQTITVTYASLRKGGPAGLAVNVVGADGKPLGSPSLGTK
ncbi:MAG: DUF6152 family protein [Pseudomonadota bacterium]